MKKVTLSLATVALVGFYASNAAAAGCLFNIAPAKGVKGSMVRAYAACPSTEHPTSNTQTEGGTQGCTPVTPPTVDGLGTTYTYGAKGKCSVQTQAKLVSDCSQLEDSSGTPLGLQPGPCHVTFVKSKCSGITKADGLTPIGATETGWSLATLSRTTLADDTNNDMTVIDFPVTFAYSDPSNGKISLSSNSAEALKPLVGANNADLPDCTQIEIVDVIVKDPDGLPFARLGGATKPQ
jgi:hypothetical protein